MDWAPPRCEHDRIILACPLDDCPQQNEFLRLQREAEDRWTRTMWDRIYQAVYGADDSC
jgi:hypothetical protein